MTTDENEVGKTKGQEIEVGKAEVWENAVGSGGGGGVGNMG